MIARGGLKPGGAPLSRLGYQGHACTSVGLPLWRCTPRAPWKRHTVQPRTAGALHCFLVRFETAEHRGAFWKKYSRFMGMVPFSPKSPPIRYIADDSLPAIIHCNMLHTDGSSFAASLSSTTKPKWREPKKGARKTLKPPYVTNLHGYTVQSNARLCWFCHWALQSVLHVGGEMHF